MLLTYVDESHSRAMYFLAALLCPENEAISLSKALDVVVRKARSDHGGISRQEELHGYDIFHGKRGWSGLLPRARIGVYGNALQAVADHDVKIIIQGVDLERLERRYATHHDSPHSIVLTYLLERIDEYAQARNELTLIIADECDGKDEYRRELRQYQEAGTWGYRSRHITTVVDTMHFASSAASRLLQAVDLVAFLHHRIETGADSDPRAKQANAQMYERVKPKVHVSRTWCP